MRCFYVSETSLKKALVCKIISAEKVGDKIELSLAYKNNDRKRIIQCSTVNEPTLINKHIRAIDYDLFIAGDIVLLEPSGRGTFIFEKQSASNAIFLTNRCNCKCLMCPQPPSSDDEDYIDMALQTIELIDEETDVLGITGGEPTLVWNGLCEVISTCKRHLPLTHIEVLTNARVFSELTKVKEFAQNPPNRLSLCIPIYSDIPKIHDAIVGSRNAYWETIQGIFNLARFEFPIEIRTVISRLNFQRLPQWSEFVYKLFPFSHHIALMGMEPFGLAFQNIDTVWIDPVDYMAELEEAVRTLNRRGMNFSIYNHQLCTMPSKLWPYSRKSISEWKNIMLPECNKCDQVINCGGFFKSGMAIKSRGISAIR